MGLRVIHPGVWATVQDLGRVGYREWGVPLGGAADWISAGLANALVGNDPGAAVLELTLVGGTYEAEIPLALALAGAPMDATIEPREGPRRPLAIPSSFPLKPGERLTLGGSAIMARTYLAVKGGWQMPVILGSRSREEPLRAGAVLPALPGTILARWSPLDTWWQDPVIRPIRVIPGPDADPDRLPDWKTQRKLTVGAHSDRMGVRLEGATFDWERPAERLSAPVAPGAVQAAGRMLLVLGVACGTMGGYPHVAHVISADLDRVGQLRPGQRLKFRWTTVDVARRIDRRERPPILARHRGIAALARDGD